MTAVSRVRSSADPPFQRCSFPLHPCTWSFSEIAEARVCPWAARLASWWSWNCEWFCIAASAGVHRSHRVGVFAAWGMTSRGASFNIAGRMRL